MKFYNDYIDNISVDDALHRKIMAGVTAKPRRRTVPVRRYTTAFACLAVVLLGVLTVPKLLSSGIITPSKNQPGVTAPVDTQSSYTIMFNKVTGMMSDNIYIAGHFWQELSDEEISALFSKFLDLRTLTATANFSGDGTLFNIDASCTNDHNGLTTQITIQKGAVTLDYVVPGKPTTSDVYGVPVIAGYWKGNNNTHYYASFELEGIGYYLHINGDEAAKNELSALVGSLIGGGAPDLDAIKPTAIPELREDTLTIGEARADADFGVYVPASVPSGFTFESSMRFINQEKDYLSVTWANGMDYISWKVSRLTANDEARITSAEQAENYDLSLYPIPRAQSVPSELREIVTDPIFRIGELTREVVMARAYTASDAGDTSGYRMRFSVLYDDILVEVNVKGADPETIYNLLLSLANVQ